MPKAPPGHPTRLAAAALLAALAAACEGGEAPGPEQPPIVVRDVVRDLLFEGDAWTVLEESGEAPLRAGEITPSPEPSARRDPLSGARPALVMAPPCEVAFTVRPEDGPVELETHAGLDRRVAGLLARGSGALAIELEVRVDGERVWRSVLRAEPGRLRRNAAFQRRQEAWQPVGGAGRTIALEPGSEVRLRTALLEERPDLDPAELWVGFARPRLVRRRTVERATSAPETPNLVLVVVDTLRADRMGCYGYGKDTTPNVDALAERGLVFEEAFATSSWTWPATASILTGLPPAAHGVLGRGSTFLSGGLETLAEALCEQGFTTAAFSGNPLVAPQRNFDQGFETFDFEFDRMRPSGELVPQVLDWIAACGDRRFFLYLHPIDPHTPHAPDADLLERLGGSEPDDFPRRPGASVGDADHYYGLLRRGEHRDDGGTPHPERVIPAEHAQWLQDGYDASVATADRWIGRVLERLAELGLDDRTVVALTSDHGEELLERGLLGHAHGLHREQVHVPLILAGPGVDSGQRVATPVSNRHLAPTLARLGGAALPGVGDALDLLDAAAREARPVFFDTERGTWNGRDDLSILGLRSGTWVLHWAPAGGPWGSAEGADGGDLRLYDLTTDPDERREKSGFAPERAERLRRALAEHRAAAEALRPAGVLPAGDATLDSLRALGYIDKE